MFHETQHKNQGGFFGIYTYFCWQFHHLEMVNLRTMGWRYPSLDWFKAKILTGKDGFLPFNMGFPEKKFPLANPLRFISRQNMVKCHENAMNGGSWTYSIEKDPHENPTMVRHWEPPPVAEQLSLPKSSSCATPFFQHRDAPSRGMLFTMMKMC